MGLVVINRVNLAFRDINHGIMLQRVVKPWKVYNPGEPLVG
jgi:hypothetical protein